MVGVTGSEPELVEAKLTPVISSSILVRLGSR